MQAVDIGPYWAVVAKFLGYKDCYYYKYKRYDTYLVLANEVSFL